MGNTKVSNFIFKEVRQLQAGVRNKLHGRIWRISADGVMAQVTMWMGDTEIVSVMTRESLDEASFKEGEPVTALIKAINVVFVK